MWRFTVGAALVLLGLVRCAFATDFELTIDPAAKSLIKSDAITIYEPYGLIKPGDHIVSVLAASLPSPSMKCKVWAGSGQDSTQLSGKTQGFRGQIRLGKGSAPDGAFQAAFLMHVVAPPAAKVPHRMSQEVNSFLGDHAWIWILLSAAGVLILVGVVIRINSPQNGAPPIYGRRAYQENLREVMAKLERITEAQELLVRKPPVLRTFRKQIDRFDHRLSRLEAEAASTQTSLGSLAATLSAVQRLAESVLSNEEQTAAEVAKFEADLKQQTKDLHAAENRIGDRLSDLDKRFNSAENALGAQLNEIRSTVSVESQATARLQEQAEQNSGRLSEALKQAAALSASLDTYHRESAQNIADLRNELSHELQSLGGQVEISQASIEALASEVAQGFGEFATKHGETAAKYDELRDQLNRNADAHAANLKSEIASSVASSKELNEKLLAAVSEAATKEQVDQLPNALEEIRSEVANLADYAAGKEQVATLPELLAALSAEVANLAERAAGSEQVAALQKGHEALSKWVSANDGLSKQLAEVQHLLNQGASKFGELAPKIESIRKNVDSLPAALAGGSKLDGLQNDSALLIKRAEAIEKALTDINRLVNNGFSESAGHATSFAKSLGDKITTLQSLVSVGTGSKSEAKAASEESLKAFAEALKRLSADSEHRERLEHLLRSSHEAFKHLPGAVENIEKKILELQAKPANADSAAGETGPELRAVSAKLDQAEESLRLIPEQLKELEGRLEALSSQTVLSVQRLEATLTANATSERTAPIEDNSQQLIELAARVHEVESQTRVNTEAASENSKRIAHTAEQLANASLELASAKSELAGAKADLAEANAGMKSTQSELAKAKSEIAEQKNVQQEIADKPENEAVQPRSDEMTADRDEPAPEVDEFRMPAERAKEKRAPSKGIPEVFLRAVEDAPTEVHDTRREAEELASLIAEKLPDEEPADKAPKAHPQSIRSGSPQPGKASWNCASGSPTGAWSASIDDELQRVDSQAAMKPMTPTETPGIEYAVGSMVYSHGRVIYGHGDNVRAFWPGSNERAILLSHELPGENWRMLSLQDKLFCVQGHRVEIIDLSTWTRSSGFAGCFTAHSATDSLWVGLKAGKTLSLEFHDIAGELVGQELGAPDILREGATLASNGEKVYLGARSSELFAATVGEIKRIGSASERPDARLTHLSVYRDGLIALVAEQTGVVARFIDATGAISKEARSDVKEMSGNASVIADKLYFFDVERSELVVCDLKSMMILDAIPVEKIKTLRRMVGLKAGKLETLLIAGTDAGGQLGSVFLLDPKSGERTPLCSTNQPHVDVLFASERPVVATSSAYQNIIRIFEPFMPAERANKAA